MTGRILCVWLPYWATTRLFHARANGALPDEALATVATLRGVRRLVSVCPRAEAAGLHAGQTLTQARALCPAVVVAEAEPAEDTAALGGLAQWCTSRVTPLAAAAPPDTLWLDIAGCDHLHGGEAPLAAYLAASMARWRLHAQWAIADTAGAAYALARHVHGTIAAAGSQAAALAAVPIEALRLDGAAVAGLRRLGLKTIGALARLPRGELAARFGQQAVLRLDQAHGAAAEPIAWPPPPPDWTERRSFAEPIMTTEACTMALDDLAARLCARLDGQRLGGRQFVAGFRRVDGTVVERAVATSLPVRDPAYLLRLLSPMLEGLDPGFGIEAMRLSAPLIETSSLQQADLTRASGHAMKLAGLIDALTNRLRPGSVWRVAPRDSHIPERAVQHAPALHETIPWPHDPSTPRPIRLLPHPERLEVTALLPDDPPVQFRWRGALHRVRAATGPERIAEEWWTQQGGEARDYYQVEDQNGARFWMFREASAWFLHGLFA